MFSAVARQRGKRSPFTPFLFHFHSQTKKTPPGLISCQISIKQLVYKCVVECILGEMTPVTLLRDQNIL